MVEGDQLHRGDEVGAGGDPGVDAAPASLVEAGPPSSVPVKRRGRGPSPRLTPAQTESALMLASRGVPPEQIAAVLETRVSRVKRELRLGRKRVEALRGEVLLKEIEHQFGLVSMLPKARKVLDGGLDQGDTKVRAQIAQWLHEAVIAKPAQKTELKIQGRVEHDLTPLFEQMSSTLQSLRQAQSGRDPLSRVQIGTAALVRQLPEAGSE